MTEDQNTPSPPVSDEVRERAEKRVKQKIELLSHIASYVIVNGFLWVIWLLAGRGYPWPLWVMAGWGIGLVFHIVGYFSGAKGDAAKEKMVQKEMDRIKKEKG
jgi:2TM domain